MAPAAPAAPAADTFAAPPARWDAPGSATPTQAEGMTPSARKSRWDQGATPTPVAGNSRWDQPTPSMGDSRWDATPSGPTPSFGETPAGGDWGATPAMHDGATPVQNLDRFGKADGFSDAGGPSALDAAIEREKKDVKRSPGTKLSGLFTGTMDKLRDMLEKGLPVKDGDWATPEIEMIKDKCGDFVTTKPQVYLVNLTKDDFMRKKNKHLLKIHQWIQAHGGGTMIQIGRAHV